MENTNIEEQTFIMIKPDGIKRGLIGEIIQRFERKGFKIVALKMDFPTRVTLEDHYSDLKQKRFFGELINFMLSGPVIAMVWQGKGIINYARKMLGETNPLESLPGTIRGDLCIEIDRNLCHASDSLESAKKEIILWFGQQTFV